MSWMLAIAPIPPKPDIAMSALALAMLYPILPRRIVVVCISPFPEAQLRVLYGWQEDMILPQR